MNSASFQFTAGLMFSRAGNKQFLMSLLGDIYSIAPSFLPVRYGRFEPLTQEFVYENASEVIREDDKDLLWDTSLGIWGQWSTGVHLPRKTHNKLVFYGEMHSINVDPLVSLFEVLTHKEPVDYGWIHALTHDEFFAYKDVAYEAVAPFNTGPTTHDLKKWLPNLAWANIFGKSYVELIGKQKLLGCSAHTRKQWGRDHVFLQLSNDVNALPQIYTDFDVLRRNLIEKLGAEFFYSRGSEPKNKKAPAFFSVS